MYAMKSVFNPSIHGRLLDRYIFNFRVDPKVLERHLPPVSWLRPRIINGFGVVSFCLLNLKGVTLWPLPVQLGFDTISCAYRCAIVDGSGKDPEPSVYVLGRSTNLPIASSFGSILFSGTMNMIRCSIEHMESCAVIRASFIDGQQLFSAKVKPRQCSMSSSKLFESLDSFVGFIKGGASSYTPSRREGNHSRVDLTEESSYYEAVDATINYSWLDIVWPDAKLVFDSAFRASGGRYKLTYIGSVPAKQRESLPLIQTS